jgi:glycosyltransferase involved in cell wall biosynthesis
LEQSVGSILGQTFRDFELVILENGSTDGSGAVLRRFAEREPRIRLFETQSALGLTGSSNLAVSHARGGVIARMDADNVAHPRRLERQLDVLERHPDATLVGSLWEGIDAAGRRVRPRDRSRLTRPATESPFGHGTIAFPRRAFDAVGGYREPCEGWEDLDLLHRLGEIGRVFVITQALNAVRFHMRSATARMPVERAVRTSASKDRVVFERFPRMGKPRSKGDLTVDVLYTRESRRLWSGERPALLGQLAARGLVGRLRGRPWLLVWAAWGRVSPRSLRRAVRLWIRARDLIAGRRLPDDESVEWRFG